jgi:hypothetical protein
MRRSEGIAGGLLDVDPCARSVRRQVEVGRDHGLEPVVGVDHGVDLDAVVVRVSDDYLPVELRPPVRVKSKMLRFCAIRSGRIDLGMTTTSRWVSQRSTT